MRVALCAGLASRTAALMGSMNASLIAVTRYSRARARAVVVELLLTKENHLMGLSSKVVERSGGLATGPDDAERGVVDVVVGGGALAGVGITGVLCLGCGGVGGGGNGVLVGGLLVAATFA